ncbi:hypothetical protein [Frondihabitans australicus]|uniref:Lipoprotein n=1 Tax=Frondihabitans australicus TaxID=386892 RepID=A0A495IEL5_9MICO|nr:hypothetical protein [Frondihabitans australicus]RKR74432.1 hypothetical protein C8E83_1545 [Frondihabitans australicus]
MSRRKTATAIAALAIAALGVTGLTGCSPQFPSITGVWKTSDGTPTKTISDDGNCTNLLYTTAKAVSKTGAIKMYVTDNPGMCHIIRTSPGGKYVFQVHQAPYWRNYVATVTNGGDTIALSYHGDHFTTLTREPGTQ